MKLYFRLIIFTVLYLVCCIGPFVVADAIHFRPLAFIVIFTFPLPFVFLKGYIL